MSYKFDVFLCHNSKDKTKIKEIGNKLKEYGLNPWLDEWNLRPGFPWQRELERQISNIGAAAVFVSSNGIGPWQEEEIEAYLREFTKRKCPVIPVLLENIENIPELPIFLAGRTWVDFSKSNPEPIGQLIFGITGEFKEIKTDILDKKVYFKVETEKTSRFQNTLQKLNIMDNIIMLLKGKQDILLTGESSVGKSQIVDFLLNSKSQEVYEQIHDSDKIKKSNIKFENNYYTLINAGSSVVSLSDVVQSISDEKCKFIIHVVCYGYFCNSFDKPTKNDLGIWLEKNRMKEIKMLDKIDIYADFLKPQYLITLVNKADLWLNHNENNKYCDVISYYKDKDSKYLKELEKKKHLSIFLKNKKYIVFPFCSIQESFYDLIT
jgi:hypothetical protein